MIADKYKKQKEDGFAYIKNTTSLDVVREIEELVLTLNTKNASLTLCKQKGGIECYCIKEIPIHSNI